MKNDVGYFVRRCFACTVKLQFNLSLPSVKQAIDVKSGYSVTIFLEKTQLLS